MLKDKFELHKLLSEIFPDFYFNRLDIDELMSHRLPADKKLIIKPRRGFFGTAIGIYNPGDDITAIAHRLKSDLEKKSAFFSESVLSRTEMIIEEFIEGDELAVDMFYNDNGEPVILNIYAHPFPEKDEYCHVLYYTNKKIFDEFYHLIINFFKLLNKGLKADSFPIHAEFKCNNGKLIPVEMNPLRFGGFGLADLTFHSFGYNPFEAYFKNYKFDFDCFWGENDDEHYGWILAYNGTDIDTQKHFPNYQKFKDHIGDYLHFVEIDHTKNPVFAIAYVRKQNFAELEKC